MITNGHKIIHSPTGLALQTCLLITALFVSGCAMFNMGASKMLLINDFDSGLTSGVRGSYKTYASPGSTVTAEPSFLCRFGGAGRSLALDYDVKPGGYAGVLIRLYDEKDQISGRDPLDARKFRKICFMLNSVNTGANVMVKIADADLAEKEDAAPLGDPGRFSVKKFKDGWQVCEVPLSAVKADVSRLYSLLMHFPPGKGRIYIDDILLAGQDHVTATADNTSDRRTFAKKPSFATWIWDIDAITTEKQLDDLIRFCRDNAVESIFVQVRTGDHSKDDIILKWRGQFERFIKHAGGRGVAVHAMYGDPKLALEENHDKVISVVDAVHEYNLSVAPESRFSGIHLDIEPYLLKEFKSADREDVLRQYLDVLYKACRKMKKRDPEMVFGADIPFWFDKLYPDGVAQCPVMFRGVEKDAAKHVIDIVDEVCVMAYRTAADGGDGVIEHAFDEVEYAGIAGKRAYVALETYKDPEGAISDRVTFSGKRKKDMSAVANTVEEAFSKEPGFAGIAIHHYETWKAMAD